MNHIKSKGGANSIRPIRDNEGLSETFIETFDLLNISQDSKKEYL